MNVRFAISGLIATALSGAPALAVPCVDYSHVLQWVAEVEVPGTMDDVAVDGDVVWIGGSSPHGVYSFDVSNPAAPESLGTFATSPIGGSVRRLHLEPPLLYLAATGDGLVILDVSDPSAPVLVGQVPTSETVGDLLGVEAEGSYAYLACGYPATGLTIVDVSDPANPQIVGRAGDTPNCWAVAVSGDLAAAGFVGGLVRFFDVTDPTAPTLRGFWEAGDTIWWLGFQGSLLYVTSMSGGFQILDVSDPMAPVLVGQSPLQNFEASEIVFDGPRGYLSSSRNRVVAYDLSNPAAPDPVGDFDHYAGRMGLDRAGSHLYVAAFAQGLKVYEIAPDDGVDATLLHDDAATRAADSAIAGNSALVCDRSGGLRIYDLAPLPGGAPVLASVLPPITETVAVAVEGTLAYVADATSGVTSRRLRIVDVSDPWNPEVLGADHPGILGGQMAVGSVAVSGGVVYWPAGTLGVEVFDASVPGEVVRVGPLAVPGVAKAIDIQDGIAYVASYDQLVTVDVRNPLAPLVRGTLILGSPSERIAVQGNVAYVLSSYDELNLVDVSNPDLPVLLSAVTMPFGTGDVAVVGAVVYWSSAARGVIAVDVSDPRAPVKRGWQSLFRSGDLFATPELVVLCRGSSGVSFLAPHCPFGATAVPLATASVPAPSFALVPNPAGAAGTGIRFTADRRAPYQVRIHDVAGRLVRRLTGAAATGTTTVDWDARDAAGRPVAAGVYFVRLSVAGEPGGSARVVITR